MDIVAWILQVLLCVAFLIHAAQMLRPNPEKLTSSGMSYITDMPSGLRVFAGVAEALAALGLVVPWATGILPWLTPLAAAGLVLIMLGAIVLHIQSGEIVNIGLNLVLLILAAAVAYLRWPALAM